MFCDNCEKLNSQLFCFLKTNDIETKDFLENDIVIFKCALCFSVLKLKDIWNFLSEEEKGKLETKNFKRIYLVRTNVLEDFLSKSVFYLKKDCNNYMENLIISNIEEFVEK